MEKSVYNFVPAPEEKEVFKPGWANEVNHDIPFEDGESGEIEIKITAQTPIFIRNGHGKDVEENEFSHFKKENGEKEYFIPATSLKGMIRNTLEIFSFSRLKTQDDIFAFREMDDYRYKEVQKSKAGWLYKCEKDKKWRIRECRAENIEIDSIKAIYGKDWNNLTSIEKYNRIKNTHMETIFFPILNVKHFKNVGYKGRVKSYKIIDMKPTGNKKLVVFGSIQRKKREFLFSECKNSTKYEVPQVLIDNLISIEKKLEEKESLWRFFRKNKIKEIPVFFYSNKGETVVKHFGLSKLYKRTDTFSLFQLSPVKTYLNLKKYSKDLVTTIFGETDDDNYNSKKGALKGRVFFGHALAEKYSTPKVLNEVEVVLSEPKASYYNFYTMNCSPYTNKSTKLSGFKKYPPHLDIKKSDIPTDEEKKKKNVISKIIPLNEGTLFSSKVRYHNLKKIELGALLSALSFHNQSDLYSHTLGGAKPLGYGKVKIQISSMTDEKINRYIKYFEDEMNTHLQNVNSRFSWKNQIRITQYLGLSLDAIKKDKNELLEYPKIDNGNPDSRYKNDFKNYLKNRLKKNRR